MLTSMRVRCHDFMENLIFRCDELQIGDMIISINGIKTQGLKHEEIIDLIKNAGDALCLEFEYNLPPWRMKILFYNHLKKKINVK